MHWREPAGVAQSNVRFAPKAAFGKLTRCAITGTHAPQQTETYSITSSARASNVEGTSMPSAFAPQNLVDRQNSYFS
jgi:hypothetical protein